MRLFIFALLFVSISAFADTDGFISYCQKDADLGHAGYQVAAPTVAVQGSSISLTVSVDGLVCTKSGTVYSWAPKSFTADSNVTDLDGNPETIHPSDLTFVLASQDFDFLGTVAAQNVTTQALSFSVDVQKSIPASDWTKLRKGQTIAVHWEFFETGILTATDSNGNTIALGQSSGGSQAVMFHLALVNGQYVVTP